MPFYEYRCDRGHTFEVMQRMSDEPVQECESCGRPVQRVFHPVAVHFKGSGFYNTDYGKSKRGSASGSEDSSSSGGDSKPGPEKGSSEKSSSKSESSTTTSSSSSAE